MRTLYLRNVPDEVVDRLEQLAGREGMSVTAFAVRELTNTSRRARNAELLESLPDFGLTREEIVAGIRADRDAR